MALGFGALGVGVTSTWTPAEQLLVVGESPLTGSMHAPSQCVPDVAIETDALSSELPFGERLGTASVAICVSPVVIVESVDRK